MCDLKLFKSWCVKVLPLVYDDSLSYYEVLCRLTEYIQTMIDKMGDYDRLEAQIQQLQTEVNLVKDELDKVKNGDYVSLYIDALANWIDKNLQEMVARIVKYIWFGLTDDGHFAAYVPDSWDFIRFDTGMVTDSDTYGHLLLYY